MHTLQATLGHDSLKPELILNNVIRSILIRNIDRLWQEHLLHIDHLRAEVNLRTVGQKDPVSNLSTKHLLSFLLLAHA